METRTVHDPFVGEDVQISNRLVDRLRGKYASGPHLPNGLPEFGWRQFQATPINLEAAERIEALEDVMVRVWWEFNQQHPDIRRIKELIAPNAPMPQPSR